MYARDLTWRLLTLHSAELSVAMLLTDQSRWQVVHMQVLQWHEVRPQHFFTSQVFRGAQQERF